MLPNINSCGILPFSYWLKIKFKGGTWITCFAYPNGSLLKSHHRNQYVRQWISVCKYKTIFRRGVKIRTIYFRILDWQSPTKIIYPGRLLLITEVNNFSFFLFSMAATHPITNTANIVYIQYWCQWHQTMIPYITFYVLLRTQTITNGPHTFQFRNYRSFPVGLNRKTWWGDWV